MGIYPERKVEIKPATERRTERVVIRDSEPGVETIRIYHLATRIVSRTDCFCCSCPEMGNDPACRNHGYAAKRPCEVHRLPGSTWDEEMSPELKDVMPESVQEVRRREKGWRAVATSNPDVAKVEDGRMIAMAPGTATVIYVTDEGVHQGDRIEGVKTEEVQVTVS